MTGGRGIALTLVLLFLTVVAVLPVAAMLGKSFFVDGALTLSTYEKVFANPHQYFTAMGHSLVLALLCAAFATLIGVPLGLLIGKTDLPFRRTLAVSFSIPLLLPPYILAICWSHLLAEGGPLSGMISTQSVRTLSDALFGLSGCLWVLVSAFMPVVMILTVAYLRGVNPRMEEAGRTIASWPSVLRCVTLPTILPGICFSGVLVFLLALGEIGAPMYLRYAVFPIETLTQFSAFYDFGAATAAATPLLAVTAIVLVLERCYLRDKTYRLRPSTPGSRVLPIALGHWRVPVCFALGFVATGVVALPLFGLVTSSLTPPAYIQVWNNASASLARSLLFAAAGATLLLVFGFLCGYFIHHRVLRWWRALDTLTLLMFALPGTVIGVGLIALWNRPLTQFLYGSVAMVMFGYLAQYTAVTSRITVAVLNGVPTSLEEAAQMSGAPWFARITHVVIPMVLPGIIAAWLMGFIFCLRDLGASMLLYPVGQDTLPVRIFTLMANGEPNHIAALCVILVALILIPLGVLGCIYQLRYRRP